MEMKVRFGHGEDSTHVTLNVVEQTIWLESGSMTVTEWEGISDRIQQAMIRAGLRKKPESTSPRSHGAPVSAAPWFLRPWYDKVIGKNKRYD